MKRTTRMVDEEPLDRAMKASGADAYSATVNKALELLIRQTRIAVVLVDSSAWIDVLRSEGTGDLREHARLEQVGAPS